MTVAQDWTKPPPDAVFNLRIPVDYASIQAAVSSAYPSPEYEVEGLCSTEIGGWTLHICMYAFRIILILRLTCQQLTGEDSYQIAVAGVQGTRVEIVSDAPPPTDEVQ